MDNLHLCIAVTPLAIYMVWLGFINLRRRPTVVSGFKDAFFLALAVSGFATAGPLELFLPETAAYRFGRLVWVLLLALYCLIAALVILSMRPRIVIYNLSGDELRPALAAVIQKIDAQSRWVGETIDLPSLEVHLHQDRSIATRNIQLVASGPLQNFAGWNELEKELRRELSQVDTSPNSFGYSFLLFAFMLLTFVTSAVVTDRAAMAQSLVEMLRM